MENRSKRLIKNTAILSLGTICTKGIMFIMVPLFTRWLTQDDYGTFDLIITYITLLVPLITLSCGEAVFRFLMDAKEKNDEKTIVTNAWIINIIGFILSFVVTIILFIANVGVRDLAFYFLTLLILDALNTLMTMIIRGMKKLEIYTVANIIFVISMVIAVTVCVKFLNLELKGILLGYGVGYVVSILFMVIKTDVLKFLSTKYFDKQVAKKMLKYSLPLIPNSISWWIVNVSDRTIVTLILGASSNAVLAVANKIPNLCQTVFNVFHLSWQENASETISDSDRDQYYTNVMNNMITVLVSVCIVILSFNFLIFGYLFTEDYFGAYYQAPILVVSIIVSMLAQFIGGIYIARKESFKNGKTTVIAAVANIIVHLMLIKYIGLYAATVSTLVSYVVLFVIRYVDIRKSMNIKFSKRAYGIFAILGYFFLTTYANNLYLNIFNLILAGILFIILNRQFVQKFLCKFIKR